MSEIRPNWKNLYGIKSLSQLLELSDKKLVSLYKDGKTLLLKPNPEYLPKKTFIKKASEQDKAISFLINSLKDLQNTTGKKMIRLSVLGIYLTKIDPNWKEKYGIKKLSILTELAEDKIKTKGEGINKHIGL